MQLLREEDNMKLLVSLNSKDIKDYLNYTNSFIIGLKNYSINYLEFDINEIEKLLKENNNIELFISVNKNIFNRDLKELEELLIKLDKLPIKGVLFYDLAVLSIVKRLNLKLDLVFHQTHMVTNYNTCNYYYNKGCKYAYLSSEITEEEMKEIRSKTNIKLMALFMGHPIVSHSKRNLISNYFEYFKLNNEKDNYRIKSLDSDEFIIKEGFNGTSIIYGNILNGTNSFYNLINDIDYAILDEQFIEHELFIRVLSLYKDILDNRDNYNKNKDLIIELIGNNDIFFNKKTIYKVKK